MEGLILARNPPLPPPDTSTADKTAYSADIESENTFNPNVTTTTASVASGSGAGKGILKKKGKPKLTNKEKKERGFAVERIVSSLPLEFRGNDPNLRRHIEVVIEGFLDREGRGVARMLEVIIISTLVSSQSRTVLELVKPPDLNQARVNKCLIALVNRKIVKKDNSTVLYEIGFLEPVLTFHIIRGLFYTTGTDFPHDHHCNNLHVTL